MSRPDETPANREPLLGLDDIAAMRSGPAPLYHSLGHIIRSRIQGGEWQPGQQIPSERRLMELCGLSRATVRQGIEYLVREGILYRVQGKGTFVAAPKIKQGMLRLCDFAATMRRNGLQPGARLLQEGNGEPPPNVRRALALGDADPVAWVQRLLLVNGAPLILETCYIPQARFPSGLAGYDGLDDIPVFMARLHGMQISDGPDAFEPVILESREASLLGVKAGVPALWIEQVGLDDTGKPALFCSSLLRGDRCRFYVGLALS